MMADRHRHGYHVDDETDDDWSEVMRMMMELSCYDVVVMVTKDAADWPS